jgi:hypothetical protein
LKQDTVHFKTDTYALPEPPPCGERGTATFDPRPHTAALYPIPPGWTVDIRPNEPLLLPDAEQSISVEITPPADFKGTKAFNINAFSSSNFFLGGITLYVSLS